MRIPKKWMIGLAVVAALSIAAVFAVWYALQVIEVNNNTVSTTTATTTNYTVAPTSAIWTASGLSPGQGAFGGLTVTNPSGANRFAVTATHTSQPLADGMKAVVWDMNGCNTPCLQQSNPDGTPIASPYGTGCAPLVISKVYDGSLGALAIGDPAAGLQTGDLAFAGPASRKLCFSVMLPSNADVALAGLSESTKVTVTGDASP